MESPKLDPKSTSYDSELSSGFCCCLMFNLKFSEFPLSSFFILNFFEYPISLTTSD